MTYTVLVVDDSDTMRLKSIEILTEAGFDALEATCGKECFDLLNSVSVPDLILLDIVMPDMSGFEVLEKLKQDEKYSSIPIIVVTVQIGPEDIVEGLNLGAADYLKKPYIKEEMIARVKAVLREKSLYEKISKSNEKLKVINESLMQANDKIEQQQKVALLGSFMISIHHEIRNPLTVALSNTQLLLKYFNLDDEVNCFIHDSESALIQIKDILNEIRDMDEVVLKDYVGGAKMVAIRKK